MNPQDSLFSPHFHQLMSDERLVESFSSHLSPKSLWKISCVQVMRNHLTLLLLKLLLSIDRWHKKGNA